MSSKRHLPDISGTWELRRKNEIFTHQHPQEVGTLQVTQQGDRFTGIVDWGLITANGNWLMESYKRVGSRSVSMGTCQE
jgi:hypothetical protein